MNDGGPAFACCSTTDCNGQTGMSLRDFFAAKALMGIITGANPHYMMNDFFDRSAETAYLFADAMLKAREAKPS